ncbi:MAG: FHA domain-containing protein [Actinomycetota bacterium]|nr:FHA domain-containing protein [Actinomycetota bacterium]
MSHGLLDILRYFLLALIWLFVAYAVRAVFSEGRRFHVQRRQLAAADGTALDVDSPPGHDRRGGLRLRILEPEERRDQVVELGREVTIGRGVDCVVTLDGDSYASSLHARVFPRNGEVWIEDLGSTNGTYVNERRLEAPARLRRGDRVRVGGTVLEVSR